MVPPKKDTIGKPATRSHRPFWRAAPAEVAGEGEMSVSTGVTTDEDEDDVQIDRLEEVR